MLAEAVSVLERASNAQDLSSDLGIPTLRALAWAYFETGAHERALWACEQAVQLLPTISSMLVWRRDRQHALAQASGLAAEAAFIAATTGKNERAVELVEETRGRLLSEVMDLRGLLDDLEVNEPELADEYRSLVQLTELLNSNPEELVVLTVDEEAQAHISSLDLPKLIAGGGARAGRAESGEESYRALYAALEVQRRQVEEAWNQLADELRARPGLSDFMRTLTASEIREASLGGAIVIIAASRYGGLASIVADGRIENLFLPNVNRSEVDIQVGRLRTAIESAQSESLSMRRTAEETLTSILAWLWDEVASPVLTELGVHDTSESVSLVPRIWWMPVGATVPLPFHAAGYHSERGPAKRTVMDRVVSSYTPTIKAMKRGQQLRCDRRRTTGTTGPLVVSVPRLPGAVDGHLFGSESEVEDILHLFPGSVLLEGESANCREVEAALRRHDVVHFACHGISDWDSPDSSKLVLDDHEDVPFTLAIAAKNHVAGATLAYLSACDTIQVSRELNDEAIHITSAFQLIGYRHVVGSLWPIDDEAARQIAKVFYENIGSPGVDLDGRLASAALDESIRQLRDSCGGSSPSLWAAHIHVGL